MKLLNNLDLAKNQILNAKIQLLASAPSSPAESQIYYDSTTHALFVYNGTAWRVADPTLVSVAFSSLTGIPTTIAGYGIGDAYTITQIDTSLALKSNISSPTFTGVPAAPTAAAATNTTQLATTAYVRTEISNLVNSAPSALDTLKELSDALGADPNFATTMTNSLALKAPINNAVFTGTTTVAADPTTALQVATKQYVDAHTGTVTKYSADIGDNSTLSFTITHNLNSRDVQVDVSEKSTPYTQVFPDITKTGVNSITVVFAIAPTTNQYRCNVIG